MRPNQMIACFMALLAASTPASAQSALPVGPAVGDQPISPFYRWNAPLPRRAGQVLRREPFPAALLPRQAGGAERLLYTTTDVRWNSGRIAASGVLYMPRGKRPAGGWPLVVWAHGTLGVADPCAPSWTGANERDRAYIARWLDEGYAVVAPDYQGLGGPGPHPYVQWQSEGRSVLDAARAALASGMGIANRIVITGQSQGSGATLGAARLAASYAPELEVRGAIATALVTAFPDPAEPASRESPGGAPHFLIYRMLSGSLPGSARPVEDYLSDKGKILLAAARTRCDSRVVAEANAITMDNAFSVPVAEIDALLGPAGAMDPFRTRFPLMLGIGLADELIAPQRQQLALQAICRAGNTVHYRGYAKARHGATLTRSSDDAVAFARAVLAGDSIGSNCAE